MVPMRFSFYEEVKVAENQIDDKLLKPRPLNFTFGSDMPIRIDNIDICKCNTNLPKKVCTNINFHVPLALGVT